MTNDDKLFGKAETMEPKWLCVFVIDVSASMSNGALKRMNDELHDLYLFVKNDETWWKRIEMCIITFGQGLRVLQEPNGVNFFEMPQITRGVDQAIELAIEKIEERKQWYKDMAFPFFRPLLILVTQEAKEDLLNNRFMTLAKNYVEGYSFDFLDLGMDGSSVYAHSTDVTVCSKDDRSMSQIILPLYQKSKTLSVEDHPLHYGYYGTHDTTIMIEPFDI